MGWFWADSPAVVARTPSGHPAVMDGKAPPVSPPAHQIVTCSATDQTDYETARMPDA